MQVCNGEDVQQPGVLHERPLRGRGKQRPCDFCRVRKTRCLIIGSPPCFKCQKAKQPCTFQNPPLQHNDRGPVLQPSTTMVTRTSPLQNFTNDTAHLLQSQPQSQAVEWMNEPHFDDLTPSNGLSSPQPSFWNSFEFDTDGGTLLHIMEQEGFNSEFAFPEAVQNENYQPETEKPSDPLGTSFQGSQNANRAGVGIPSTDRLDLLPSETDQSDYSISFLNLSSEFDTNLRARYVFDQNGAFKAGLRTFRRTSDNPYRNAMLLVTPRSVTEKMADSLILIPEEPLISEFDPFRSNMVALFNRFVHPTYPISIFHETQSSSLSSRAVITMIYAYSWNWRSHDSHLPWAPYAGSHTGGNLPNINLLYKFVWQAISREMYAPSLATIHACLLFLHRIQPRSNFCETPFESSLLSSLVEISFSLGLHRNHTSWNLMSNEAKEDRQATWWLVYIQDKWLSAVMGRRPSIRDDDFDTPKPILKFSNLEVGNTRDPAPGGFAVPTVAETHLDLLLRLTDILGVILSDLTAWKAAERLLSDIDRALQTASDIESQLDSWRDVMLKSLNSLQLQSDTVHFGNLKIAYIYCRILVFRSVFRVTQNHIEFPRIFNDSVRFLDLVATELRTLTIEHFALFWFSWTRAQFNALTEFIVFLYTIAPVEQKDMIRAKVERHRQWLWIHSKYIKLTRVSLVRLDSLLSATDGKKLS
ncbi:hypothetical protein BGZ60DRAFT_123495 [Tricladium varicosporioides]|nr:hypothetical protein BGZ60DRAFT_123495 [Hymenoscyphus varicosporioides]